MIASYTKQTSYFSCGMSKHTLAISSISVSVILVQTPCDQRPHALIRAARYNAAALYISS